MADTDAITMTGVEQTAKYTGYGRSLRFAGPFEDSSVAAAETCAAVPEPAAAASAGDSATMDDQGSHRAMPGAPLRGACVVAIDAVRFHPDSFQLQLSPGLLHRELFKALAGFGAWGWETRPPVVSTVATGKWGCGVFNGCNTIKLLVQWLAASHCGRSLQFYVFDGLPAGLSDLVQDLGSAHLGVAAVWDALLSAHADPNIETEPALIAALRSSLLLKEVVE